jgi:hypothetical protein
MPFDLTFEEPPTIGARGVLSWERRSTLRRAIGDQSIERSASFLETAKEDEREDPHELIPLHVCGLLEDLKHDWLAAPIIELFEAISEVGSLDLTDDAAVGARLRRETQHLVCRAEAVSELVRFMNLFEPSIVHELVRPAAVVGLMLTGALVEWMASETDEESADRGDIFNLATKGLREHRLILCALPYSDRLAPATPADFRAEDEIELLIGVDYPRDAQRWIDVLRHLEAAGHDLCELGSRQLRYFGPYRTSNPNSSRNFFDLGLRIGRSAYPLLAHRSAYLAWQLFERATAVDEDNTLVALHGLLDDESLWMIASHEDYLAAVARYRAGDQAAIVEAYSDLAEGTLRRYGSLVVALARIAAGKTVHQPLVMDTIADVENQLGVWQTELLPALILRFLERRLRNAEAHANVVVDVQGTLQVKQRDGTVETVIPNHVYGRAAGLRSVLDGVDVAMNHASIRDKEKHTSGLLTRPTSPMSASVFERVVQHAAEEHTPGSVSGVTRRDQALTMTYHGRVTYGELRTFANSLTRLLGPTLPVIRILDKNGGEIEVFRPPQRRPSAGRNDPCPCGSGRKYKRCHGA